MTACQFYLVVSAVLVLLTDRFAPIFRQSYSVWLVPTLFIGIFICLILLQFLILLILILTQKAQKKPSKFKEGLFRLVLKHSLPIIVSLTRTKINVKGIEKLPLDRNVLFVCNHQHNFDPVIIFSAFTDSKISFIGKKDILEEMPFVSKAMSLIACLFIDRENDREGAKTIVSAIKYLKSGERSVAVFPEGYTSKTDELLPFRNGTLKMALKAKVPVAVCVLNNTKAIPKNMFRRKTGIDFRLLDVIYPETYENMTTSELGELIHNEMENELKEIKHP